MNESEVLRELSRRTSLPEETSRAVFEAVCELVAEGLLDEQLLRKRDVTPPPEAAQPNGNGASTATPPDDPSLVEDLIARAKKHPLGIEFLLSGLLASVAIGLGAHAFTVEAARRRLRKEQINHPKDTDNA